MLLFTCYVMYFAVATLYVMLYSGIFVYVLTFVICYCQNSDIASGLPTFGTCCSEKDKEFSAEWIASSLDNICMCKYPSL